jgi:SAM-dependent methyltransferase
VDAAWARWVFAFVRHPKRLLQRVADSLRPGGVFIAHEYFDYSTWRLSPRSPELEEFVQAVMADPKAFLITPGVLEIIAVKG